jgi:uncharacterized protein DUF6714
MRREASEVIEIVRAAFDPDDHPGDRWLQGSFDGCEPYDEIGAFQGLRDWRTLEAAFLDQHYTALSFFSEAGLRYYIPAYIVADIRKELQTADPVFHLTHGFTDASTSIEIGDQRFVRTIGRTHLINPLRYGALTSFDYARYRLSIFCREEATAILAYLEFAHQTPEREFSRSDIERAIAEFWTARAADAPDREALRRHNAEEKAFTDAILKNRKT